MCRLILSIVACTCQTPIHPMKQLVHKELKVLNVCIQMPKVGHPLNAQGCMVGECFDE